MAAETHEDFKLTSEEAARLREALQREEFRKLLSEYADEISDPENKKIYEEEIKKLEEERGYDVQFVHIKPGFVLKTTLLPSRTKTFINIGQSDRIDPAMAVLGILPNGKRGSEWSIPYSITKPKEDIDGGKKCLVIDVTYSPETYKKIEEDHRFTGLLISTALTGIERDLGLKIDRKHVKRMKFDYKGTPQLSVIRDRKDFVPVQKEDPGPFKVPYPPLPRETKKRSAKQKNREKSKRKLKNEPKYTIVHRGEFDMQDHTHSPISNTVKRPTHLIVTVELPQLVSSKTVELDVFERQLVLHNESPTYHLKLALPHPINTDTCSAKFDKSTRNLIITLPVLPSTTPPPSHPYMTTTPTLIEPINEKNDENGKVADEPEELISNEVRESKSTVRSEWSVTEEWQCPPFSYRQNEDCVSFVVHVPIVKATTVTSHFDEDSCHVTFKGSEDETMTLKSYSFYLKFIGVNGCGQIVKADECKIDIGSDNMVIVVAKATTGELQKFRFGHNPAHLEEKLFLTDANTTDVIHRLSVSDDPWQNNGLAEIAEAVDVLEKDTQQCVLEIVKGQENGADEESHEEECKTEEPKAAIKPTQIEIQQEKKATTPSYCNGRTDIFNPFKSTVTFSNELLFDLD